jgi:lipoprotein-anchoring transpeptidase ErfK/SrfK
VWLNAGVRRQATDSKPRSTRSWGVFSYPLLTVLTLAFLGWLWWGERPPVKEIPPTDRTNAPEPITFTAPLLTNHDIATSLPKTVPLPRPTTNAMELPPHPTLPAITNAPGTVTQKLTVVVPPPPPPPAATNPPVVPPPLPRAPGKILEMQVALARRAISSGSIDARLGSQTRAALRVVQKNERQTSARAADPEGAGLLPLAEPVLTTYTVAPADLARLTVVGQTWLAKSRQERLDYETILELVAEKAKSYPTLIRSLNQGIDWTNVAPGTVLTIPNAAYPPPRAKAAFVRIRLGERTLEAFDGGTNLIAHFPCSIASRVEKRPVGRLFVEKIASYPSYRFDPENFPESAEAHELGRVLMIPPGPNNPVGTAWIGLNKPGYGIHGTPKPEEVGRTESHGCFRLANWNAEYLLQLVSVGTPVLVEP